MPRRLLFALLVLVAAPLALLGWLSESTYRQQQKAAKEQLESFFQSRLAEIDGSLSSIFDGYARQLDRAIEQSGNEIQALRQLDRESPIVRASFFVNDSGILIYPPKPTTDASEQVALYASLPAIVGSKPDLTIPDETDDITEPTRQDETKDESSGFLARVLATKMNASKSATKSAPMKSLPSLPQAQRSATRNAPAASAPRLPGDGRWQVWYMDEGIQLIYWMPRSDGAAVGVLLERARWIADMTAALPDSTPLQFSDRSPIQASGFTALSDESEQIVYRWGDDGPYVDPPLATRSLSPPLTSWQLEYHSDNPLSGSASTALVASLAGIAVVLLSLGAYVLTGVQRQMQAARNRVSFASQVSHELRTPLTNIRLYAELAESDLEKLPETDSRASIEKRLAVIDTESRRLGRLVSGVLEMIRDNRKEQGPRIAPAVADEVIDQTLTQFAPSFENADLTIVRESAAGCVVGLDVDILEMILVNLLSNVEKYASGGGSVKVSSRMQGAELIVRVADHGPGIAWRHRRSVFRPFSRLDDSISAPSGTGIGLTIARRLARRHGGDLELVSGEGGACFELRLPTEKVNATENRTAEVETRES
jgi:signal transduction histidine kinase